MEGHWDSVTVLCCVGVGVSMCELKVCVHVCVCLRSESSEGLEVYLHAIQLLTTVDEGIQAMGKA